MVSSVAAVIATSPLSLVLWVLVNGLIHQLWPGSEDLSSPHWDTVG